MRILLIEDAPGHALAKLQQEGVTAERTPQDRRIDLETVGELGPGLDRLAAEVFDLVVVDLTLPDSRGLETFGQVRTRAGHLPIVVLVGLADLELGFKAVERGAQDYLVKEQLDSILLVPVLTYARKRHQLAALWAAEALEIQTGEANYRNLVAGIEHALIVTDAKANILFQNPRAAELLDRSEPDLITALMIDAARSGGVAAFEVSASDGSLQHLEYRVAAIRWDGRNAFLLALNEAPAAAAEAAAQEVSQPAGKLDELIVDVASEQRGPLASISGFLELLSRGRVADPAVQQEFYDSMMQQVERLTSLASHLPDLVQMGTDRLPLELGEIDLEGLVSEVVLAQQVRAREKDLTLQVSVPRDSRVRGDRERLHEALAHVLDNAIKFSTGPGSIRISGEVGDQVTIRIADCGPGVPPEARQQIFERFFQASTEVKRDFGGAGIGLYKARKIIEAHGGRIGVGSNPGGGSTFYLSLPAGLGAEREPATHLEPSEVEATAASASARPAEGGQAEQLPEGGQAEQLPKGGQAEQVAADRPAPTADASGTVEPEDGGATVAQGLHVIWLGGGSCDGCTMAVLGASDPGIEDLLLGNVPDAPPVTLVHPALALESGDQYLAILEAAAAGGLGPYVMVLEGVVFDESLAGDGYFSHMGEDEAGRPLTIGDWIDRLATGAAALIAIGTCATGGGIPAALGSPTGAMSLCTYLGADFTAQTGVPLINIPGCAPSGEAFIETVVAAIFHLLGLSPLELDEEQRPRWLYSQQVHPMPPRAHYMPEEAYATEGPTVGCPVHSQGWMNHIGGCANVGGACIGCTAPDFADRYLPLTRLNEGISAANGD